MISEEVILLFSADSDHQEAAGGSIVHLLYIGLYILLQGFVIMIPRLANIRSACLSVCLPAGYSAIFRLSGN